MLGKEIVAELLHGNRSRKEYLCFQPWLDKAAQLTADFARDYDDDPFAYNETASVSLLCSAAVAHGYLALAEFMQLKRARHDRRSYAPGRWDLWVAANKYQWGIEFKQIRSRFMPDRIEAAMEEARACAVDIVKNHTDRRMACLIASLRSDSPNRDRARKNLTEYNGSAYAWRIDLNDDDRETYLFFDYVD
jgi:hypothetical protein